MDIHNKLRNARMNANMTQELIAEKINVSRQTISNWEREKSLPDIISLIKISEIYEISLDDLLIGDCKMIDKIDKDTNTVKSNQTMANVGWIVLIFSFIFSIWNKYGGDVLILQFFGAAAPWLMLGVGLACLMVSYSSKKKVM